MTNKGITVWVVTNPTADSCPSDCMFPADAARMILQVRGGLSEKHAPAFHFSESAAWDDLEGRARRRGIRLLTEEEARRPSR